MYVYFSDLSEVFGCLSVGVFITIICVCCYIYSRLSEEQRQQLGRAAALAVRVMDFIVRLWNFIVRRNRQDHGTAWNENFLKYC